MCKDMLLDDMDLDMVVGGKLKFLIYKTNEKYYSFGISTDASMASLKSQYAGTTATDIINSGKYRCSTGNIGSLDRWTSHLTKKGYEYAVMN